MTLRVLLAALGVAMLGPSQSAPRPRDPHRIAEVLGLRENELRTATCTASPPRSGRRAFTMCGPNERELPRLVALRESWGLATDTAGAFYSGNRDWRPAPAAAARVRDSVARALDRRAFHHLHCPDSTQQLRSGVRSFLSIWQGPSFRVLLFHVRHSTDSLVQVGLQVAADTVARCFVTP